LGSPVHSSISSFHSYSIEQGQDISIEEVPNDKQMDLANTKSSTRFYNQGCYRGVMNQTTVGKEKKAQQESKTSVFRKPLL
jgi:hypothetical protein